MTLTKKEKKLACIERNRITCERKKRPAKGKGKKKIRMSQNSREEIASK